MRRLGLSPTVAAQIQRYRQVAGEGRWGGPRRGRLGAATGGTSGRLAAGLRRRRPAGGAVCHQGAPAAGVDLLPVRRRGARPADCAALGGPSRAARLRRRPGVAVPEGVQVRMAEPLSVRALPDGSACDFYGAAYGELLRRVTGFEGAMLHDRCRGRGDEACVWGADGRGGDLRLGGTQTRPAFRAYGQPPIDSTPDRR